MAGLLNRESVEFAVDDDGGLLFDVEKSASGRLTAKVRVWGRVVIDDVEYEYDRDSVRVALKKVKS